MTKEIAVIGSSSAGLFAAYRLAGQGCPVKVYEAREAVDCLSRVLIVTPFYRNLLGPLGEPAIINTVKHFELFANGRMGKVSLKEPDLVIDRRILMKQLQEQVSARGGQILTGWRFDSLHPDGEKLAFLLEGNGRGKRKESADVLIGADGTHSQVARSLNFPAPPAVPLVQAVVDLPRDMAPDTTRVWFIPEETPYFFWLIPQSPTRGVLGLIGTHQQDCRKILERFLEKKGLTPLEFQQALVPCYRGWRNNHKKLGANDVYLVGDAAGHVKVTTVGGIVTGLRGALGVVKAILENGSRSELGKLRKELDRHYLIRGMLNRFRQQEYIELIDLLNPQAKAPLENITRDEAVRLIWKLLTKQPRLILLGLRALLLGNPSESGMLPRN